MTTETAGQARAAMAPVAEPRAHRPEPESVSERFRRDTASHEMTILHDESLYRHLRFKRPDRGEYWFDLITWPGCLAINGDCGSFMFSRLTDMFEFFRGHEVNPGYWAEKVRAGDRSGVTVYSPDRFRQLVTARAAEAAEDWPGLPEAVERDIFGDLSDWNTGFEDGAREALRNFEYGASSSTECACGEQAKGLTEDDAVRWRRGHGATGHRVTIRRVEGFCLTDAWEWDLSDYTHQFLWCCHAIPWGISQYDDHAKAAS